VRLFKRAFATAIIALGGEEIDSMIEEDHGCWKRPAISVAKPISYDIAGFRKVEWPEKQ